jgi:hypothetical protein
MNQSLSLETRIQAFVKLGTIIGRASESILSNDPTGIKDEYPSLYEALQNAGYYNPWFTKENIAFSLKSWGTALKETSMKDWISHYEKEILNIEPKCIAVIMAGNIPLVGFHDFLCVLLSGHQFIGKLSSDDKILLSAVADVLCKIEPAFRDKIRFSEETLKEFDAIVATGSNNTARYFDYYFTKYPHIIRKNRNGVAVLSDNESDDALKKLGSDICLYFGLGCRNVSKLFLPAGYEVKKLFAAIEPYAKALTEHNKYLNNYSYRRSVYLLNLTQHLDNGVMLLVASEQYSSPISVLYYEFYENSDSLQKKLNADDEHIQCIVTDLFKSDKTVTFGETQTPGLDDYADGIDTLKFLTNL